VLLRHGFPLFVPVWQIALLNAPCCVVSWAAQNTPVQLPVPTPVQHA